MTMAPSVVTAALVLVLVTALSGTTGARDKVVRGRDVVAQQQTQFGLDMYSVSLQLGSDMYSVSLQFGLDMRWGIHHTGADLGFFRGRGGWSRGAAFLE